jgi:hypothetical protein
MRIAIGECETAHALRIAGCENLRDAAAAIVAYQVDLLDVQRIQHLPEHLCIGGYRHVLLLVDFGIAMRQQVRRDAAPEIRERSQLMPPQMPVEQHAVHKQRNRPLSLLRVGNRAGRGFHACPAGGIALLRHVIPPGGRRGRCKPSGNRGAHSQQEIAPRGLD